MAMNKQTFKIAVQGCETHGATPHLGADTILAASAIVEVLQTIISRNVDPLKALSIVVGTVHSGTRFNIVAGNAVIEGSVFAPEDDLLSWAESEIRNCRKLNLKRLNISWKNCRRLTFPYSALMG